MFKIRPVGENDHPELSELIAKIKNGRGDRFSYPYKLLLHSPAIAAAWLEQVSAVRWKTDVNGKIREMVIIRIGLVTRVGYVSNAHMAVYGPKEGITAEQLKALSNWKESPLFSEVERATLAYVDAMTIDVQVSEAIKIELQRYYNERQIIDLTVLIGTYNMHTRVFQALDIEARSEIDRGEPPSLQKSSYLKVT